MLSTRTSGPKYSHNLSPTSRIASVVVFASLLAALSFYLIELPQPARASGTLSTGSISYPGTLQTSCPGSGWFTYQPQQGAPVPMTCYQDTVTGCANAQSLNFFYGYIYPVAPYVGTIVFLSGGDGITPSSSQDQEQMYAADYYAKGYEIVQVEWSVAWEQTDVPSQSNTPYAPNIQYAACRQATFLKFVHDHYYSNTGNAHAGMCAQGASAGSAAVAYSLAYYGAGDYLDNVELMSGPVLSDIKQGCIVPNAAAVTVCGQNNGSQIGCQLGNLQPWSLGPQYTGAANGVRSWTYDQTCNAPLPEGATNSQSNLAWWQMSIVDDGTNSPTFSYPTTSMTGWLCQSVQNQNQCVGGEGGSPQDDCPNNSSPQGQIFYAAITANQVVPQSHYAVYAVKDCGTAEGVGAGGSFVPGYGTNGLNGFSAIETEMETYCKH
jgi:hypothetical protein